MELDNIAIIDINENNIDKEEAQNSPISFTTYSLFYNGEFITNEMQSDKGFIKMLEKMGI